MSTVFHERLEYLGANDANLSGRSNKFYEVKVTADGSRFTETRRWGRFGAKGQTKVLTHYYERGAVRSAREQLDVKRSKGYTRPVAPLNRLAALLDE